MSVSKYSMCKKAPETVLWNLIFQEKNGLNIKLKYRKGQNYFDFIQEIWWPVRDTVGEREISAVSGTVGMYMHKKYVQFQQDWYGCRDVMWKYSLGGMSWPHDQRLKNSIIEEKNPMETGINNDAKKNERAIKLLISVNISLPSPSPFQGHGINLMMTLNSS